MNSESFSKIASGIQSIAVVIGLVIGGWWALKTFIFQNPAFYEQGSEVAGWEPELIKADLSLERLNALKRQYEITLTLTNESKTLREGVMAEDVEVLYFRPTEKTAIRATFSSLSSTHTLIDVPVSESRQLRFLAEFPHDGVYIVEVNLGKKFGNNCLSQKYVSVVGVNTIEQRTPASRHR